MVTGPGARGNERCAAPHQSCAAELDDIRAISGLNEPEALLNHSLNLGAKVVALKLGADGAPLASAIERHRIAPSPSSPVDATGAGDTFGGAFVARWVAGDGLRDAARYIAAAGVLSAQGSGPVAPIRHAAAARAALETRR